VVIAAIAEIATVRALDDEIDQRGAAEMFGKVSHLSIHGVCSTKRRFMLRLNATCSALMMSSRQSG